MWSKTSEWYVEIDTSGVELVLNDGEVLYCPPFVHSHVVVVDGSGVNSQGFPIEVGDVLDCTVPVSDVDPSTVGKFLLGEGDVDYLFVGVVSPKLELGDLSDCRGVETEGAVDVDCGLFLLELEGDPTCGTHRVRLCGKIDVRVVYVDFVSINDRVSC